MARCSYHPNIETEMRCAECGKPICPKEMVSTPVGYKCPEDARPVKGQYQYVKPRQLALATVASLVVGIGSGLALGAISFGGIFIGVLWGFVMAETVRRASGGHRGVAVMVIAVLGIVVGWLAGSFTGGIWWATAVIAGAVTAAQLGVLGR